MRHIFVSYCHEDADFAQILDAKVREQGFSTWRDLNLSAGDDWRSEIDDGIKNALAVVVIMSPSARISPYVNFEWAFGIGCGVPVVPVLLKLSPGDLHPRLSVIQCLDFSNYLLRPWEKLVEALRELADAEREFTLRVPRDAPPVVRQAAIALDDMDRDRRRSAIASLAQMNHPAAIELLAEAVRHPIQEVRFGAAFQLGEKHHDPRALPALMEAVRCGNEGFRQWMVSRIGEPAVPTLIQALKEEQFKQSGALYLILGDIGGPTAVQALVGYLRDPDPAVRRNAAFALSSTKDSSAMPALRGAMSDPDAEVRRGVASALEKCGGVTAIQDLLDLLHDSESGVRHQAVCGLEEICALRPVPVVLVPVIPRLTDALIKALDDRDSQVNAFARRALENLADPRAVPGLIAALGQSGTNVREIRGVMRTLGTIAVPAFRQAINDPNERVRLTAIEILSTFGDDADAPCVAEMLRDTNPDVRLVAIRGIGSALRRSPVILQALVERLHDPEEDVCIAAIEVLGEIGNVSVVPHLAECLKVEALAPSAANALQEFDTRDARAALKAWSKNKKE
jgi:HEAT repeat protein